MLNPWGLFESEREAGQLLGICVASLAGQTTKFGIALALADHCDEQRAPFKAASGSSSLPNEVVAAAMGKNRQFIEWKQLAADAGAIAIYNYAELIQTIQGLLGYCPTAKERYHGDLLKTAKSDFDKAFPGYAHVRFAVAHAGKPFRSPEVYRKQRLPGANWMVVNMLDDRTLKSTVNGKAVEYSLIQASLDTLVRVTALIEDAFAPVRNFTLRYSSAQPRETPPQPSEDPTPPPQK